MPAGLLLFPFYAWKRNPAQQSRQETDGGQSPWKQREYFPGLWYDVLGIGMFQIPFTVDLHHSNQPLCNAKADPCRFPIESGR